MCATMLIRVQNGRSARLEKMISLYMAVTRGSLGSCGLEEFHFGWTNAEEDRGQENEGGKCVYNDTGRERAVFHSPMGPSSIKRR